MTPLHQATAAATLIKRRQLQTDDSCKHDLHSVRAWYSSMILHTSRTDLKCVSNIPVTAAAAQPVHRLGLGTGGCSKQPSQTLGIASQPDRCCIATE